MGGPLFPPRVDCESIDAFALEEREKGEGYAVCSSLSFTTTNTAIMIPAALGMSLRQASAALRKTDIAPRAARGAIGAYGLHATGCTQARRSYSTNDGNNSSGSGSIGHLSNSTGAPARSRWLLVGGAGLVAVLGLSQLARRPKIEAEAQRRLPPAEVSPVAAGVDGFISMDEVADHNSPEKGLWVVIKGEVYE